MAKLEFKLPDIGEGIAEGEIVAWHVEEGDKVAEDQVMVEVMTDKATVTIGAPRAGKIEKLLADVGHTVRVGDVIVIIHTGNGSRVAGAPAASAVGDIRESLPGTAYFGEKRAEVAAVHPASPATVTHASPAAGTLGSTAGTLHSPPVHGGSPAAGGEEGPPASDVGRPLATPAVRKLARDLKVDLASVTATGGGGRVTREDVMRVSSGAAGAAHAPAPAPALRSVPIAVPAGGKRIPFVGMRRRIAENMRLAKDTAAHFTFVEECEVDRLVELRARLQPEAQAKGVELSYLPFVIKAMTLALVRHPMLNASLDTATNELVLHDRAHVGIAAATDQGLVVPVIHDAGARSVLDLAREVSRLAAAARDGKLTRDELVGSTITITSLGKLSGYFATPILNVPNAAILGLHRIKDRPVVRDGQIVVGKVMLLSLTFDHRIVDGHVGAAFAYDVIAYLEDPARLLLDL